MMRGDNIGKNYFGDSSFTVRNESHGLQMVLHPEVKWKDVVNEETKTLEKTEPERFLTNQ